MEIDSMSGAYSSHLATLSEDSSVKPIDSAKFKGYLGKWTDAKYLLGCAMLTDLLTPCAIFFKSMQADKSDILGALRNLLRTVKKNRKLITKPLDGGGGGGGGGGTMGKDCHHCVNY